MKSLRNFLKVTFTGGILFLLPFVLILVILNKAHLILLKISAPLSNALPDIILGLDGSNLIAIGLLVIVCFFSGLIFRSSQVRKGVSGLEDNFLSFIPGYGMLKSITSDAVGRNSDAKMATVLVRDEDAWQIAFLVEENAEFSTVFIPNAPAPDSGEVKIVPTERIKKINVSAYSAARSLRRYGKGAVNWMENQ